jgi:hypothetical protein
MPNYENFLKATNKSLEAIMLFLQFLLFLGRKSAHQVFTLLTPHLFKSAKITISIENKVGGGVANRGRSTKGWVFGFKLHGVCNEEGFLEDIMFSPGSPNDKNFLEPMSRKIKGYSRLRCRLSC